MPPKRGVSGMSNPGQTLDTLERLRLSAGLEATRCPSEELEEVTGEKSDV